MLNTNSRLLDSPNSLPKLEVLQTFQDVMHELRRVMLAQRVLGRPVEILEAGCGSRWDVKLEGLEHRVIGVDLDAAAVEARLSVRKDLDEAIIGDLHTVELGLRKFDIIFSSFVLEHVVGVEALLERFVGWLRPGGIILIRVPDPDSVKGLITRITPHWFHVWYYRVVLSYQGAGEPGKPPYPTIYEPVVSRSGMLAFAKRNGLIMQNEYGTGGTKRKERLMDRSINIFTRLVSFLSLGRFSDEHSDLLFVLRLPP